ncbi:MAG: ATP-dependent helicase [Clostridium beijerinckii]|nr:ATP-dependent helicase [Clostridium beijerinckii]
MRPTQEQENIIKEEGNLVVNACPGSGKTFTVSKKIIKIIEELEDYQGLIAISYTNKASRELKQRCLKESSCVKSSFFGTVHKFIINEIIFKFYRHIISEAKSELSIENTNKFDEKWNKANSRSNLSERNEELWKVVRQMISEGIIALNKVPKIALMVLEQSTDCQMYLKSRYKYIFIDEYQDCTDTTHVIFKNIVELGVTGVAVGDLDQAIFSDSDNLLSLWNDDNYKSLSLSENHRCHESIVQYSRKLMDCTYKCNNLLEKRVFQVYVKGNESTASAVFPELIEKYMKKFSINNYNDVAILTWSNRTAEFVSDNIGMKHRVFFEGKLDKDNSKWGGIFTKLLDFYFDSITPFEFASGYFNEEYEKAEFLELYNLLKVFKRLSYLELKKSGSIFETIARLIQPEAYNQEAINLLYETISKDKTLSSYGIAADDEVQIMTLHKSKGLEFRLVFHMDLNAWCFPGERGGTNEVSLRNLHYVGLTRAKDAVVLFTTTIRTNSALNEQTAYPSKYLYCNELSKLRIDYDRTDGWLEHRLNNESYYKEKVCNLRILGNQ